MANKKRLLATLAWIGSFFAALIFFATGDNWQLAAVGIVLGNLFFGAAGVVNDSILPLISDENERDRVSSRGWAFGYLGGGLLLVLNLAVYLGHDAFGLSEGLAARLCMLSAAAWWAGFTLIPFLRLNDHPPVDVRGDGGGQRVFAAQLRPAGRDPARHAQLPDGAHLPARLPVLQRRHPDRHRLGVGLRLRGARPSQSVLIAHDPDGAVRRLRRRAALRTARRPLGGEAHDPGRPR